MAAVSRSSGNICIEDGCHRDFKICDQPPVSLFNGLNTRRSGTTLEDSFGFQARGAADEGADITRDCSDLRQRPEGVDYIDAGLENADSHFSQRIRLFGRTLRGNLAAAPLAFAVVAGFAFGFAQPPQALAATITSAGCSQSAVQSAIGNANVSDTVQVPSGNCSWSGLSLSKAIHLKGAGVEVTNITLTGNNTITKQAAGVTRISGFSFSKSGGGNGSKGFTIGGSWQGAEPVVVQGNEFTISGSGLFRINVAGGVIIADNDFKGGWDDSFIQPDDPQDSGNSWRTADTLGARDTTGKRNLYFEDNTFYGGTNQGIDCDAASRCVYRYNTLTYSSFNTHGRATSPHSVRHFEVYKNQFRHNGGTSQIANQSWAIWIRGGTGVVFNNDFDNLAGSYWGNKPEMKLTIRGAEDARPQGSCGNVRYPVPEQLGQNYNGSSYFTDPIYIWGNTGATAVGAGWNWGNPCGFSWATFFQWGRDAVNSGTPKPGYAPYTYPHPLRAGGGTAPPSAGDPGPTPAPDEPAPSPTVDTTSPSQPVNLAASAASSTLINVSWSASTDDVAVTDYRLQRCSGANCSDFSGIASPSGTSYADTGLTAGTTYRYRVRATDAAGNRSSYSSVASATTQNQTAGTPGQVEEPGSSDPAEPPDDGSAWAGVSTLFRDNVAPTVKTSDPADYELGVRFQTTQDGQVTGLRYYRGSADANDTDTRTLNLWSADGDKLVSVTIQSTSGQSGWQAATLPEAVALQAGETYVASYGTVQNYAYSQNFFGSAHVGPDGVLTAPGSNNGVFANGQTGAFPTQTYRSSNYWVDIAFEPMPSNEVPETPTLGLDVTPDTIAENGGVATGTVTRSGSTAGSLQVALSSDDTGEATVPASVTIGNGASSATFTVRGVDDAVVDGTQEVALRATASGATATTTTIDVTDNDVPDNNVAENDVAGADDNDPWGWLRRRFSLRR